MAAGMAPLASRPEYMNATPHHSKLRVTVTLSSSLFVAGEEVTGKMEMECRADSGVGIGLIMAELFAIQELNSRDHSATSTFLHIRRLFQGPGLPPSNAVVAHPTPGQPPLPQGHFPARRGVTTFFFRFPLPLSSPSAVSFASGLARVRYEVRASVSVAHRGEKRVVTDTVDADVVQCEDMDSAVSEHVVVGENGKVYVQGRILGGRLVSGQQACIELHVKNHSLKKTTGLSLALTRALHLHSSTSSAPPLQLTDTLVSQNFRGAEYTVQPGTEGVATLVFDVPNAARVVKGGPREGSADGKLTEPLFELRCVLAVSVGMGIGSKDVLFEIPVQLSHPATLPSLPDPTALPLRAISPPNPHFTRSPGSGSGGSSPAHLHEASPHAFPILPLPSSPQPHPYAPSPLAYVSSSPYYQPPVSYPQQRLWSPPPPAIPYFAPAPGLHNQFYFPPPPGPLVPFAHPTRPSSTGAQLPLPTGLPGVGVVGPFALPGVGAVTHPYTVLQPHRNHNHTASNEPATQHTPPPSQSYNEPQNESTGVAEEGKGARASRIAQHLHTPARARSASPTSHRFPGSVPTESPQTMHNVPPKTPHAVYATTPRNIAAPPVLSPRPMRSPRHSFSPEAGAGGRSARSVDLLERMVDPAPGQEGRSVAEVLRALEQDKTLPSPPVPSGKTRVESVPRARDVFSAQTGETSARAAAASKKMSVLHPSPMARRISWTQERRGVNADTGMLKPATSGLDALEQRLQYEVGTRKPDKLDRPTILPAGNSVASGAPGSPAPLVSRDSEISELALASNGSDALPTSNSGKVSQPINSRKETRDIGPRASSAERWKDKGVLLTREEKTRKHEVFKLRKEAKGRVADWLGAVAASPSQEEDARDLMQSPTSNLESNRNSPEDIPDSTETRRASPFRTAASLLNNSPAAEKILKSGTAAVTQEPKSPRSSDNPVPVRTRHVSSVPESTPARSPWRTSSPPLALPKSPTLPKPPSLVPHVRASQETSPKGGLTADIMPGSNKPVPRLPKLLSSPVIPPETRYDVRSARGGKGGITTSVAAIWTSLAEERTNTKPTKPLPKPIVAAPVKRPAFLDIGKAKPTSTSTKSRESPDSAPVTTMNEATTSAIQTQQPRNMIKSASVPAAVVSSHAKPHLSSTASLARPFVGFPKSNTSSLSPTFSRGRDDLPSKPVTKGELAFGQARLKDLIQKYQQGTP